MIITGLGFVTSAQSKLQIRIINQLKEPVSFATAKITSVADSNYFFDAVSDSLGIVSFSSINSGQYIVSVTSLNYAPLKKGITIREGQNQFTMSLDVVDSKLNAVVVTANRPLFRQEDDKTIVDPEVLAASSTSAYEILEQTPGLFVDQDGNIYLNSTRPATVYINGREQKMSAADISTMLKNLPPNAIASIEILRTPSARYDASGSGGIVNVVLKKGTRIGMTGSVTLGLNQGTYGNQFAGLNINNNNGRVTTYFNFQVGNRNNFEDLKTDRLFSVDSLLGQDAYTKYNNRNVYGGYGISLPLSSKWDFSYDGRVSYGKQDNNSSNLSKISHMSDSQPAYSNITEFNNKINNLNINQGLNFKNKIDSLGSEWVTDLSFSYSPNETDQVFSQGMGTIDNKLKSFSVQSNFVKKLAKQITLETGLKSTLVKFDNETDYKRWKNGSLVSDENASGSYNYRENINSGYVQASKNFSGFILKLGTRLENTNMSGKQILPTDTSFDIHRTDFFPYVYLSRSIMKISGYDLRAYLVYRRTLVRPAYENLNPSIRIVDPFLYETGNPSLRPQFTQNYEANISVDERPIFAVGINETKDIFSQVIYPSDSSGRISVRTYDNLGRNKETYFRVLGAIPPGKRFFFVVGAQYNHNFYQGSYDNEPLSYKRGSWSLFTYQQFKVTPNTQVSLNGFVRFNGQIQFYELSTFGQVNMSLTQQLFNRKLSVTLSGQDLFYTNKYAFRINQGNTVAKGSRIADTRRIGLNIRYNFGFRKKEDNNIFNVESPEKAQRP